MIAIIVTSMRSVGHVRLIITGVAFALAAFSLTPVNASSANISHSYKSATAITSGSLVSLDPSKSDYVIAANTSNASRLLGIVVVSDDSLLAVDAAEGKVQVATSGTASTLVSDVNGDIKVGDQVAVSPFDGIGMKAEPGLQVIGLAQTEFKGDSSDATAQEVKDKSGHAQKIKLGYARLNIGVIIANQGGEAQLNGLQKLVKSITGHTVSTVRIVTSLVVAAVALIALITLIYGAIYGSIISIGRNPLAKFAVFRTLGSVLTMAVLTAIVAGVTIFFLLK